jgi:hypothetical protein
VVVSGRYDVTRGTALAAQERFRVHGYAVESWVKGAGSGSEEQRVRIALDGSRDPQEVEIERACGDDPVAATRLRLRFDRAAGLLRSIVKPPSGATIERVMSFDSAGEAFFASPLFPFMTVSRLRLRPGERRDVAGVWISPENLMPEPCRRRYRRLPDVELEGAQGSLTAADYVVEPLDGPAFETRFAANLLGLPLRLRIERSDPAWTTQWMLVE